MSRFGSSLLLVILCAGAADAQRIDVPDVVVGTGVEIGSTVIEPDVAAGIDGTMLFAWRDRRLGSDERYVYGRRLSATGVPLAAALRLDDTKDASSPRLAVLPSGSYLTTWRRLSTPRGLVLRRLGSDGTPAAPSLEVAEESTFDHALAPLPSAAVAAWTTFNTLKARRLDATGQPLGPPFTVASVPTSTSVSIAATTDGFFVAWSDENTGWGRRYDADGLPLGPAQLLTEEFAAFDVSTNPLGGFMLVGHRPTESHARASGVWGQRLDATGAPLGTPYLIHAKPPTTTPRPQAAFDSLGNLYVAWSDGGEDRESLRGRAYDPAGRALGPTFRVSLEFSGWLETAVLPDGRMVNAWGADNEVHANVIALCTPPYYTGCGDGVTTLPCERCDQGLANSDVVPDACRTTCHPAACGDGVIDTGEQCDDGNEFGCDGCDRGCQLEPGHVCGDGVTFAPCGEECDDGPANSNSAPDACRTSCQLPGCGDGVGDAGEACDDGNLESCDGCSAICVAEPGLVCGDGIPELECDEQCDDGNSIVGDGCTEPCRLERIRGGGSVRTDCLGEFVIDNPANVPLYEKKGGVNRVQSCVDGDPRCDFDGEVSGSCTFSLKVCANNTDVEGCSPPSRIASFELTSPSVNKAAGDPALAAVRAAFASVPGSIVGPATRDVCSNALLVALPLRHATKVGKLALKTRMTSYENVKDNDALKLTCLPAGP